MINNNSNIIKYLEDRIKKLEKDILKSPINDSYYLSYVGGMKDGFEQALNQFKEHKDEA